MYIVQVILMAKARRSADTVDKIEARKSSEVLTEPKIRHGNVTSLHSYWFKIFAGLPIAYS
jgi:hypothetical protein